MLNNSKPASRWSNCSSPLYVGTVSRTTMVSTTMLGKQTLRYINLFCFHVSFFSDTPAALHSSIYTQIFYLEHIAFLSIIVFKTTNRPPRYESTHHHVLFHRTPSGSALRHLRICRRSAYLRTHYPTLGHAASHKCQCLSRSNS
jgi:hypothetical protein